MIRYWAGIVLCALGGHKFDDTPNYIMRETWRHEERRVQVWTCHRCPHWKVKGMEAMHDRTT